MSPILLLCIIATVFGSSTQFGYNIGVINNPEKVTSIFELPALQGAVTPMYPVLAAATGIELKSMD